MLGTRKNPEDMQKMESSGPPILALGLSRWHMSWYKTEGQSLNAWQWNSRNGAEAVGEMHRFSFLTPPSIPHTCRVSLGGMSGRLWPFWQFGNLSQALSHFVYKHNSHFFYPILTTRLILIRQIHNKIPSRQGMLLNEWDNNKTILFRSTHSPKHT